MTSIYVGIPVSASTLVLYVDKGRKWNVVEHLLLFSLSKEALEAEKIVHQTQLPWRLIVEVMSRLMRVGWVELVSTKAGVTFRITTAGQAVVANDTLPAVTRPFSRRAGFSIDKVTGTVFKAKGLSARSKAYIKRLKGTGDYVELAAVEGADRFVPSDVIGALLEEDEHCRGIEPIGSRFVDSFAVVTQTHGDIDGLPSIAPSALRQQVVDAADAHLGNNILKRGSVDSSAGTLGPPCNMFDLRFDSSDLIVGGEEHFSHIVSTLQRATSWVVIHSTFVTAHRFESLLPYLSDAAAKGVRIDILWGKSKADDGSNSTEHEVDRCRDMLSNAIDQERIRLHNFTTNSHAKLLLADNGRGLMSATVGSCNWLSSSFESLDVSITISAAGLVGEVASKLSKLAMGDTGHWSSLVGDLASLAVNLKRAAPKSSNNATGTLVLGSEHNDFVQRSRDTAKNKIHVVSHKVSKNVDTLMIDPMIAAKMGRVLRVDLTYSEYAHVSDVALVDRILQGATSIGINSSQITSVNVHAKFIAWDEDHVVITSQNILSADPLESSCSEIGIYVCAPGIAVALGAKFDDYLENKREL